MSSRCFIPDENAADDLVRRIAQPHHVEHLVHARAHGRAAHPLQRGEELEILRTR